MGIRVYVEGNSGCSFHMIPYKEWLDIYIEVSNKFYMGNDHVCNVIGIRKCPLEDV